LRPSSLSPSCVRSTRYRLLRDKQNALPFPFRCAAGANELVANGPQLRPAACPSYS
jgi:hypothetical protein